MVVPKDEIALIVYKHVDESAIIHVHAEEVSGSSRHQKTHFKKHKMNPPHNFGQVTLKHNAMLIVDLKTKVFLMFLFAVLKPIPTLSSSYYHKMATKTTTTTQACAEIVTFRLKEGVTPSQFRAFAQETTAVLKEFGGWSFSSLDHQCGGGGGF
jgi:hypothetical protein